MLVKAQGNQKRSSDRMVLRHENKHPPSVCKKGDGVIVKVMKNDTKIKGKGKTFIISNGKVLERSNNRYKIKYKVGKNDKSDWFPVSMITSETRAEEFKRKQKAKMNIARKQNTKRDVNGKINFSSTPGNSHKDYVDENTNSMSDENKILQDEGNVQYDFRKTIVEKDEKKIKTRAEKKESQLFSNLLKQLRERNLKLVNVRGDGNCFFRAIAHQMYGGESQHQKVREEAVQEVIKNSNRHRNFVAGSFDKYVSNLSTDREWADNAAIQATSNAFRISTEILNDSERIPSYTILPFDKDSVASPQHVVVGYIDNVHYVSTEFHEPFPPAMWGGSIAGSSREFVNTCPVDGPLTWLVYSMALVEGFSHYILEKLPIMLKIFESFQAGNSVKGMMLWYESQLKKL